MSQKIYDIIGDVHGNATKLERLLSQLGYRHIAGCYRPSDSNRIAIFVGDLIDKGPEQLQAVRIARSMRDAGLAHILMGNHEFNAIGYASWSKKVTNYYRRRTAKNTELHADFLNAVKLDSDLHKDLIGFFRTLPLWQNFGTKYPKHVVHACWHKPSMTLLKNEDVLNADGAIRSDRLAEVLEDGTAENIAVCNLVKGPEINLPGGVTYRDEMGHERDKARLLWWGNSMRGRDAVVLPRGTLESLPEFQVPRDMFSGLQEQAPVFFGHYALDGTPMRLSANRVCLDFGIAYGRPLCAYVDLDNSPSVEHELLTVQS